MACRTASEGGPYPQSISRRHLAARWNSRTRASNFVPVIPANPLAGHDDADQAPVVPQPGQQAKQLIAGSSTYDLVVSPVPLTKLSLDDTSPSRIVVNVQQDWRIWHARHLWALTSMPTLATTSFPAAPLRRAVRAPSASPRP